MSVSIDISTNGYIIESQNYLSNYLVTINTDQNIYGIKTLEENLIFKDTSGNTGIYSLSSIILNDDFSNNIVLDVSNGLTITNTNTNTNKGNYYSSGFNLQNVSSEISLSCSNNIQLNVNSNFGNEGDVLSSGGINNSLYWNRPPLYGLENISSNRTNGSIFFGRMFDSIPFVVISQRSNDRIVPICITDISYSSFNWASSSSNVGQIVWSASI